MTNCLNCHGFCTHDIFHIINDIIEQHCHKPDGLLVISVTKRNKVSFTIAGENLSV